MVYVHSYRHTSVYESSCLCICLCISERWRARCTCLLVVHTYTTNITHTHTLKHCRFVYFFVDAHLFDHPTPQSLVWCTVGIVCWYEARGATCVPDILCTTISDTHLYIYVYLRIHLYNESSATSLLSSSSSSSLAWWPPVCVSRTEQQLVSHILHPNNYHQYCANGCRSHIRVQQFIPVQPTKLCMFCALHPKRRQPKRQK